MRLALFGSRQRTRTDSYDYLGTDLGTHAHRGRVQRGRRAAARAVGEDALVGGGEEGWYRFPNLPERDGQSTLAYGGFRTDETALISGLRARRHAVVPARQRARSATSSYADVSAAWTISPKTKLGGQLHARRRLLVPRDDGATPTNLRREGRGVRRQVADAERLPAPVRAAVQLVSDGRSCIVPPEEGLVPSERDDRIREAGGELGYQFRSRVRVGVTVSYTEPASRRSRPSASRACWPASRCSTTRRSRRSGRVARD